MSTLEKAIGLLQEMPKNKLEAVYMYMRFVNSQAADSIMPIEKSGNSESMNGLRVLQSFAGTLPKNFDYKRELEEAREEKYDRFN